MIFWIIVYVVIMCASIVGCCILKSLCIERNPLDIECGYWGVPCLAGVVWPIGLPVYGSYLAARWIIKNDYLWRGGK